jgi:hypothetical protein
MNGHEIVSALALVVSVINFLFLYYISNSVLNLVQEHLDILRRGLKL